ncbi:MAG: hypothetical protein AAF479_09320, partial [Pseudomonadota bacterium]
AQRSAINDQLAPQFDPSLMIDFESPIDEDMEFRRNVMKDNAGGPLRPPSAGGTASDVRQ